MKELQESLKLDPENWNDFALSNQQLQTPAPAVISDLGPELEKMLYTWKVFSENPSRWSKVKGVVKQAFTTASPFFKNFLSVVINAQSVCLNTLEADYSAGFEPLRLGGKRL